MFLSQSEFRVVGIRTLKRRKEQKKKKNEKMEVDSFSETLVPVDKCAALYLRRLTFI